jgi:DNA ligase (NAD+)
MGISIGAKITVGKAGEIIPKIVSVEPHDIPINIPAECPMCGFLLEAEGKHLICHGPDCLSKSIAKLTYFYGDSAMYVKSIGKAMFAKILNNPLLYQVLRKYPYALLDPEVFCIDALLETVMGEVSYNNYREALSNISGKRSIIAFMTGLGYTGLAEKNIVKLYHYMNGAKIRNKVKPEIVDAFVAALNEYEVAIKLFENFKFSEPPKPPQKMFCITGTLSIDRADMVRYLEEHQFAFVSNVTSYLDFLVVGKHPGKTKLGYAERYKVPMITEEELKKYINEKDGDDESSHD